MTALLSDAQVTVTTHETSDIAPACDNCDAPHAGVNGVHWTAQDEPVGLLNVCDACLYFAFTTALDDAPDESTVTCERLVQPARVVLGVAA